MYLPVCITFNEYYGIWSPNCRRGRIMLCLKWAQIRLATHAPNNKRLTTIQQTAVEVKEPRALKQLNAAPVYFRNAFGNLNSNKDNSDKNVHKFWIFFVFSFSFYVFFLFFFWGGILLVVGFFLCGCLFENINKLSKAAKRVVGSRRAKHINFIKSSLLLCSRCSCCCWFCYKIKIKAINISFLIYFGLIFFLLGFHMMLL